MAMEDALRMRKSVRAVFTKTVNSLMEEFGKEAPNGEVVKTKFLTLDRIYSELKDFDDKILKNIGTDEEFEKEYNKIEEYREKMDLVRISIHPEDRDFLIFFWLKDYEKSKMKIFRRRRLVLGLSCSPFLLGAVIRILLENCPQEYCVIAEILKKCFYMDNFVTYVDTEEEISEFVNGATELMKLESFELRGWENTSKDDDSVPSHVLGL
ncbi:uncharacterized protein TNCV_3695491 [Trichonephila clavipes]|nr:uncharacterized protein TNCV_3695491 [Trichonephila clavipes]